MMLTKLLYDLKIKSNEDLRECIKEHKLPLKYLNKANLEEELGSYNIKDYEIHGEAIELTDMIIDISKLAVSPEKTLTLRNCIFYGKTSLNGNRSLGLSQIEIENCIFLDELIISGFSQNDKNKIGIFNTNAACISMFKISASEIIITGCKVFFLSLHRANAWKLEIENNCLRHFEVEGNDLKEVVFDHKQFDLSSMGNRIISNIKNYDFEEFSEMKIDMDLFSFIPFKSANYIKRNEAYNTMLETIGFLKKSTSISSDRNKFTQLLFLEVLLAQDRFSRKAFVYITGGFLKPMRFIMIGVFILVIFMLLYMLPIFNFSIAETDKIGSLSLEQAMYFSGITFTTIGYGDICPIGISRIFAVMEGILGISSTSCLMVALVKKYID